MFRSLPRLLLLLWAVLGHSAVLGDPVQQQHQGEEIDLQGTIVINQIAIAQLMEEQRSVDEGVRTLVGKVENLTNTLSTHLTTYNTCVEGVRSREDTFTHLLDKVDQLIDVNKYDQLMRINTTLETFRGDLREVATQELREEIDYLKDENERVKEEIRLVEEDSRKTKNDVRLAEEESRQLKADMRTVEQDMRVIKERNKELERRHLEVEEERNQTAMTIVEIQRDKQQQEEINREMEEAKKQLEDKISHMEEENRELRARNEVLSGGRAELERQNRRIQEEKDHIEEKNRLMEEEHQTCKRNLTVLSKRMTVARDCAELYCRGERTSGVYGINPGWAGRLVSAWCDMDTDGGGWTVFITRDKTGTHEEFSRDWQDYQVGFGDPTKEHWLGTEALHQLTSSSSQVLHVDATNLEEEQRWARWGTFSVGDEESEYQLQVDGYQADSTMGDFMVTHHNLNGRKFSTRDKDNDGSSSRVCVEAYSVGGGWWYNNCAYITPTGPHMGSGKHMLAFWTTSDKKWISVNYLQMKIRPREFPACVQS